MCQSRKCRIAICICLFVWLNCVLGYAQTVDTCEDGGHQFKSQILIMNDEDTQGEVQNTCENCGYSYIEYLPSTGHNYGEWQDQENGIRAQIRTCVDCQRSETREVTISSKTEINEIDFVLTASIGGVWSYGAFVLWYNGLVLNWYKKACYSSK